MSTRIDMTGERYGQLTVLEFTIFTQNSGYWKCKCDCGNECYKTRRELKKGVKSCGCLRCFGDGNSQAKYNLYKRYKDRHIEKGFNISNMITKSHFFELVKQNCFYCNSEPLNNYNGFIYNGLDRIDSELGYSKGNVRTSCRYCNFAKNDRSEKDFYCWIKKLNSHLLYKEINKNV